MNRMIPVTITALLSISIAVNNRVHAGALHQSVKQVVEAGSS